jgi:hypothetical protein
MHAADHCCWPLLLPAAVACCCCLLLKRSLYTGPLYRSLQIKQKHMSSPINVVDADLSIVTCMLMEVIVSRSCTLWCHLNLTFAS